MTLLAHPQLVASLEALLQQPTATPGRTAIAALRRSTTTELPAGPAAVGLGEASSSSGATPALAATLSFARTTGRSEAAGSTSAGAGAAAIAAAGDSPGATPTLPRAPTNRWRLAAERAASFRSPPAASSLPSGAGLSSLGATSSRPTSGLRQVSFAPSRSSASPQAHSPADGLLAEIARAITPAAPLASAAAQPAADAAPASPVAVSSLSSGLGNDASPALAASPPAAAAFTYPALSPAARQQPAAGMGSPLAGPWQAVAASRPTAGASSYPASPVASFGFAAHSPAPVPSLAAGSIAADFDKVVLRPVQLDVRPPGAPDQT